MGSASGFICRGCGARFTVRDGGGFFFDLLHCNACGATKSVSHQELGDIHLGFVKGLPGPYALARAGMDQRIKETYQGEPLTRAQYRHAVEAILDGCLCGGRFTYSASARCSGCRSTSELWDQDPDAGHVFYD